MPAGRNPWIDVLRGISAMAVVLFHFNVIEQTVPAGAAAQAWHAFWQYGHLGVGVFFTLSGYFLIPAWTRAQGAGEFLRHRAWRLLPPYWCSLLLIAGLAMAFKLALGVNDIARMPRSPFAVFATLTLLTSPVSAVPALNWVYWTLSYLMAFTLLAALPLFAPRSARVYLFAGLHLGLCRLDVLVRPAPVGAWFFVKHWPVFGLGAALALWVSDRRVGAGLLLVSAAHAWLTLGRGLDDTHYILTGWVTVGIILATVRAAFPSWLRAFAEVGATSYSLYLIHVPVGVYALWRLLPESPGSSAGFIGKQLLLLGATLVFARLFFQLCERPFNSSATRPATT